MIVKIIKNIIFDLGNVIFNYNPKHIVNCLYPKNKDHEFYIEYLFNSEYWQELDAGQLSAKQVIEKLALTHNLSTEQKNIINNLIHKFTKHLILNTDMKLLFENLSASHNIFILSNFQSKPFQTLNNDHSFLNLAKGKVISADVKMKKPELGIYHYLISQYFLNPQECIFIDDLKANVETAKKLQIKCIQFKNVYQTKRELNAAGIKC